MKMSKSLGITDERANELKDIGIEIWDETDSKSEFVREIMAREDINPHETGWLIWQISELITLQRMEDAAKDMLLDTLILELIKASKKAVKPKEEKEIKEPDEN